MSNTLVRWLQAIGLLTTVVVLAACGGNDESSTDSTAPAATDSATSELVEAAKKEGKVVWYNSQNPERGQQTADDFQKKYGIKVEMLRLSGSQITTRYSADVKAGNVPDAITAAVPGFFEDGAKDGLFQQFSKENLPAFADWPADATLYDDTTALIGTTPWVVVTNTEVVKEEPATWEDLLKPEFKKNTIFVDPRIVPTSLGMANMWLDKLGPDFLTKFGEQSPTIVESSAPGMQSLTAGEAAVLVATEPGVAQALIDEGAPVKSVSLSPMIGTEMMMALSKEPTHPNAAKLLMNYVMSPEGQAAINGDGRVSPLPDIEGTEPLPDGYVEADLKQASENSNKIAGLLGLR